MEYLGKKQVPVLDNLPKVVRNAWKRLRLDHNSILSRQLTMGQAERIPVRIPSALKQPCASSPRRRPRSLPFPQPPPVQ
jgi:hypothetical protein